MNRLKSIKIAFLACCFLVIAGLSMAQEAKLLLPYGHHGKIDFFELSADGKRLITRSKDSTIIIWDTNYKIALYRFEATNGAMCFAKSGKMFAIRKDEKVYLFKEKSYRFTQQIINIDKRTNDLGISFSDDERFLVIGVKSSGHDLDFSLPGSRSTAGTVQADAPPSRTDKRPVAQAATQLSNVTTTIISAIEVDQNSVKKILLYNDRPQHFIKQNNEIITEKRKSIFLSTQRNGFPRELLGSASFEHHPYQIYVLNSTRIKIKGRNFERDLVVPGINFSVAEDIVFNKKKNEILMVKKNGEWRSPILQAKK